MSGNEGKGKVERKYYAQYLAIAIGPIQSRIIVHAVQHIPYHLKDKVVKATTG